MRAMNQLLIVNAAVLLIYMTGWFIAARLRNRLDTVDNAWAGGYLVLAIATVVQHPNSITRLILPLVFIWAIRLTSHIARRNSKRPEDPRYVAIAQKWKGNLWTRAFFSIFLLQGLLIWIIGLPISLGSRGPLVAHSIWLIIGAIVWIIGTIIESIGDRQLKQYLIGKPAKTDVLDTGLWRYSRHPNYFGEIGLWYGIALITCASSYGWIGLIGPTVLYLTIRYASGVPPIENKRKDNPAYQAYKKRTSVLFPLPPR
jgi:steroid 5-alpha reductase family enzyme